MRRRAALSGLVMTVTAAALATYAGCVRNRDTVPITYDAKRGILVNVEIDGREKQLSYTTLCAQSTLLPRTCASLPNPRTGIDALSPEAQFSLGRLSHREFFSVMDLMLPAQVDGILGNDFFDAYAGLEGAGRREAARITVDTAAGRMSIDARPGRARYVPESSATIVVPLQRDYRGFFVLFLPVNDGPPRRFMLGLGFRDVILPANSVLQIDPATLGYAPANGPTPVTLKMGGQEVSVIAMATHDRSPTGVLGMTVLAYYRVVLDYRDNMLYLEPNR